MRGAQPSARADSPCASAISASVRASIMRSASSRTRPRALSSKRSASSNSPAAPYSRAASKANPASQPEEAAMCESLVLRGRFEVPPGAHQRFGTRHARRVLRIAPWWPRTQAGCRAARQASAAGKLAGCEAETCSMRNTLETRVNGSVADSTGRARAGTLFLVATPIGNLQDLSARAQCMPARSAPAAGGRHATHAAPARGLRHCARRRHV